MEYKIHFVNYWWFHLVLISRCLGMDVMGALKVGRGNVNECHFLSCALKYLEMFTPSGWDITTQWRWTFKATNFSNGRYLGTSNERRRFSRPFLELCYVNIIPFKIILGLFDFPSLQYKSEYQCLEISKWIFKWFQE